MEGTQKREVLFETRRHASRPYTSNYPPTITHQQQQLNGGARGSFLSRLLPSRGIAQLKEKWSNYKHPRRLRKSASLFVSPGGDLVAVASRNQITILRKEDDYQEPCGIFTCENNATFMFGVWAETHDVLGVVDDADMLYLIRANGEEITRIPKRYLKVSSPIIGLIVQDDINVKASCLCTFSVFTSDGSVHDVEISQDPSASVFSGVASTSESMKKQQFPQHVVCLDYHPKLSLLAVVNYAGSTQSASNGLYSVSLWQKNRNLDLKLVATAQFEGSNFIAKGNVDEVALPKVRISVQGKSVAILDVEGSLVAFKFDNEHHSLSFTPGEGRDSDIINSELKKHFNEIVDFAWWSDDILTIAARSGIITMFDMYAGVKLLETDTKYLLPLLERSQHLAGNLFLLESKSSSGSYDSSEESARSVHLIEWDAVDMNNQFDWTKLGWTLVSFSERSILEMYDILIAQQEYQAALQFAERHGLNKDEALKSQWLHSSHGISEIRTLLANIKDKVFVLSECVDQFGPTEDAVRALLDHGFRLTDSYRFSQSEGIEQDGIWDFRLTRLRLLHLKDRLETFLGINTGRFSVQEYKKFCNLSIKEAAIGLGESGKIGALNLLFKRHPYSLTTCMLDVLSAIPETIPVQTYGQLLPGSSPPPNITLREEDWVECFEMVAFISKLPENHESNIQIRTEPIIKQSMEYQWPSITELSSWYKNRARDIDNFSGQLDNCISLIDFACRKGIHQLKPFLEDISYLNELIYSDEDDNTMNLSMSLATWENLSDYERFKLMLVGVNEENVIRRLHNKAIPFMKKRLHSMTVVSRDEEQPSTLVNSSESFLVRWLKDIASQNKLEMCLIVIEEGCKEIHNNCYFIDDAELVDCALQCIYLCSVTDRWSTMASILSKLPNTGEFDDARLKERLRLAEGHVEAGRLFTYYQVPKPISFFLGADSDGKGIKQILRLILSKFIRRQPVPMDSDWANMWRDLQYLQEKAFPFIDLEYVLIEFCRGLLKAGKFSLARSYLRGAGSVSLATDKAENLVIQAAREYFFSASSLSCSEIWKAKECLNIFPNNRSVIAEADIIDAVTVKLPSLGVNLLPMQFKQIKDPMEIIKLAITSHSGAYLNVDEIIEIAKLLGLSSQDDISAVQEAIAREAAVVGDLQLAFDLCLILAKKGHVSAWDLCAALARGPALDNMDISSRKRLLGFALSHCDGESIGELLHGWKDLDIQGQCESLIIMTGKEPQPISAQDSSYPLHGANRVEDISFFDQDAQLNHIKGFLFQVAKDLHLEGDVGLESILRDNGKILSFAAVQLPWLLELSQVAGSGKKFLSGSVSGKQYISVRTQAIVAILSWLARNGFAPKDTLVASLAKSIMEPPVTEEEDFIGCSYLLNLVDALNGVGIIEENLRTRENYSERTSIMNVGMIYGLLNNSGAKSEEPAQRRELILRNFQQKNKPSTSDERDRIDKAQSTFWKAWKLKLEDQKRLADHSRVLEQIIPGVETTRFLSGDTGYKESAILSLIESVKLEKKHIFKDVSNLAHTYGLD
nr:MAG2-interacting protein 2 [Ipomoea batatas]